MTSQDQTRVWVDTWLRAAPVLQRLRWQRLRDFDYQQHLDEVNALLEIGCQFARPRPTSGLVQQQRLFQRARP